MWSTTTIQSLKIAIVICTCINFYSCTDVYIAVTLEDKCSVTLMCLCNSSWWKPTVGLHKMILMWVFSALQDFQQTNRCYWATPHPSTRCSTGHRPQLRHPGGTENRLLETICILDLLPELFLHSLFLTFYSVLSSSSIFLFSSFIFLSPFHTVLFMAYYSFVNLTHTQNSHTWFESLVHEVMLLRPNNAQQKTSVRKSVFSFWGCLISHVSTEILWSSVFTSLISHDVKVVQWWCFKKTSLYLY